jgi:serine/threonine protein kinase
MFSWTFTPGIAGEVYILSNGIRPSSRSGAQYPESVARGLKEVKGIVRKILKGLAIMHSESCAHRDLKPAVRVQCQSDTCVLLSTLQNILVMKASPPPLIKPGDSRIWDRSSKLMVPSIILLQEQGLPRLLRCAKQPTQKTWTTQTRWIYGLLDALPTSHVLTDHSSFLHLLGMQLNKDSSTVRVTFQKIALSSARPGRNSFVFYWQWTPKSAQLHLGR